MTNLELTEDPLDRVEVIRPDPTGLSNGREAYALPWERVRWEVFVSEMREMRETFGGAIPNVSDYVKMGAKMNSNQLEKLRRTLARKRKALTEGDPDA